MFPVVNLWKLPEGDVDSLSGTFRSFVVSGSQGRGGELPLGRGGWGRLEGGRTEVVPLGVQSGPVGVWEKCVLPTNVSARQGSAVRRATWDLSSTRPISQADVPALCHLSMSAGLPSCSMPGFLSFCSHCLSVGPKGKTVRLVLPAACVSAEACLISCPSVNLPAVCLPAALIAADSLAPGLHFVMAE